MPLSVHFPFVLQLLMVLKERPLWPMCQLIHIIEINALKCSQHQLSSGQSCKANQHLSSAKLYLPSVSAWFWIEQNISKNALGLYGSFATHTAWKTSKQLNTQVLELNKLWTWKTDLQFECKLGNRLGSCLHFRESSVLDSNMRPTKFAHFPSELDS